MKRKIISQLKSWKDSPYRKPLILAGARQVGKTYILKEFGKQEYDNVAYINCDGNSEIADIFAENYDMSRVLMILSAITKQPINPGKTLIILDEIQELRKGLSSLKYFCEDAPEYHIAGCSNASRRISTRRKSGYIASLPHVVRRISLG